MTPRKAPAKKAPVKKVPSNVTLHDDIDGNVGVVIGDGPMTIVHPDAVAEFLASRE